jgi:starvation-inducible DNA-binding protein
MRTIDFTGIKENDAKQIVDVLQQLLANYQVFYTNLRGFHWNIKGTMFYALHTKFEEMYNDATEKADEIAERILMLNGTPEHNFSSYLKKATIKETAVVSDASSIIANILETLKLLIAEERKIAEIAGDLNDEATSALMSDYIREQEKNVWMFAATATK